MLVTQAAKFGLKYALHPPRPPHWGGYRLMPDTWEFWQGRKSRLHDRLRYRLQAGSWVRERLAPEVAERFRRRFSRALKVLRNFSTFGATTAAQ